MRYTNKLDGLCGIAVRRLVHNIEYISDDLPSMVVALLGRDQLSWGQACRRKCASNAVYIPAHLYHRRIRGSLKLKAPAPIRGPELVRFRQVCKLA